MTPCEESHNIIKKIQLKLCYKYCANITEISEITEMSLLGVPDEESLELEAHILESGSAVPDRRDRRFGAAWRCQRRRAR